MREVLELLDVEAAGLLGERCVEVIEVTRGGGDRGARGARCHTVLRSCSSTRKEVCRGV